MSIQFKQSHLSAFKLIESPGTYTLSVAAKVSSPFLNYRDELCRMVRFQAFSPQNLNSLLHSLDSNSGSVDYNLASDLFIVGFMGEYHPYFEDDIYKGTKFKVTIDYMNDRHTNSTVLKCREIIELVEMGIPKFISNKPLFLKNIL